MRHEPTPYWYRRGCRCPKTRRVWSDYSNDYRRRRAEPGYAGRPLREPRPRPERMGRAAAFERNRALAIVAQRQMRALMRIGHSVATQARAAEISECRASEITGDAHVNGIYPKTAARITAMYERLQYVEGGSDLTRAYARKHDFPPPAAWTPEDLHNPEAGPTWPYRDDSEFPRSATA